MKPLKDIVEQIQSHIMVKIENKMKIVNKLNKTVLFSVSRLAQSYLDLVSKYCTVDIIHGIRLTF